MKTIRIFSELSIPHVYVSGASTQGDRDYQQDAMFYKRSGGGVLAAVCDGMGGLEGGEQASLEAIRILEKKFDAMDDTMGIPRFFEQAAVRMDKAVAGLTGKDGRALHAGTTVTAVYTIKNELYWMSVGDSKLYIYRNGAMEPMTTSHNYKTWVKLQEKEGKKTEAYNAAKAEALVSYLGMNGILIMDYNKRPFIMKPEDVLLLCTDGLYKAISETGISQMLEACKQDFDGAAESIIDAVREYGAGPLDNCTVLLLKYHEEDERDEIKKM